jgi:hypothetical protein
MNGLSGSIPTGITLLTNLQIILLHNNLLNGTLPTGISTLSNLKFVRCGSAAWCSCAVAASRSLKCSTRLSGGVTEPSRCAPPPWYCWQGGVAGFESDKWQHPRRTVKMDWHHVCRA